MKTRTRIVAWVFAIYSSYVWLVVLRTAASTHGVPWWLIRRVLPWVILCPFWIGLLKRKAWAWWPLVALHALTALAGLVAIIRAPGAYLAHPNITTSLARLLAIYLGFLAIEVVLPLWILLTDRPSGWANPQSVPPEAGSEER